MAQSGAVSWPARRVSAADIAVRRLLMVRSARLAGETGFLSNRVSLLRWRRLGLEWRVRPGVHPWRSQLDRQLRETTRKDEQSRIGDLGHGLDEALDLLGGVARAVGGRGNNYVVGDRDIERIRRPRRLQRAIRSGRRRPQGLEDVTALLSCLVGKQSQLVDGSLHLGLQGLPSGNEIPI